MAWVFDILNVNYFSWNKNNDTKHQILKIVQIKLKLESSDQYRCHNNALLILFTRFVQWVYHNNYTVLSNHPSKGRIRLYKF